MSSFNLTEPAKLILKEIVPQLNTTNHEIVISSYMDIQPIPDELAKRYSTDRELSFAKAVALANYLQSLGVSKNRITCIGYGAIKPVDSTNTQEGRSKNRRIEIIVKP